MKKVLLATTAVVLSAGVASADVSLSGNARFGLQYDSFSGNTRLEKRMTVNIDGSTETTSGMTFGARLRLRSNEAAGVFAAGARVYMKSGPIEVAVGNINGAIESMSGLYDPSLGLTGLGWGGLVTNTAGAGYWGWDAYSSSSNGVEGIEFIYSGGAFGAHLSYSEPVLSSGAVTHTTTALALSYTMNDWTFALAMQDTDLALGAGDKVILTAVGKIGDYGVGVGIADNNGTQKIALNGSATFGATTVSAYVADEDTAGADVSYGLGVSYDLGGASVVGGISHDAFGTDRADVGVSFSF